MIINLTQHHATPAQKDAGVVDLEGAELEDLRDALTFDSIPSPEEIERRAEYIAEFAVQHDVDSAMIGGAPFLMAPLERALEAAGVRPLYAFSIRESEEVPMPDGGVRKINKFRHVGFV